MDSELLTKARDAARAGNLSAVHLYLCSHLTQHPNDGVVFSEYLETLRRLTRLNKRLIDIAADGMLGRILSASPQKTLESCFEKLRANPFDLDAVQRIARAAQTANWPSLAAHAFSDVLRNSPTARNPQSPLGRDTKFGLGRAHYALKDFPACLAVLKEFEGAPDCPKDIAQILKDAAASLAAATFQRHERAFTLATNESRALAERSAEERKVDALTQLEAQLADPTTEPGRIALLALQLSDLYIRARSFDKARLMLDAARVRAGRSAELEQRVLELQLMTLDAGLSQGELLDSERATLQRERERTAVDGYRALAALSPTQGEIRLALAEALMAMRKSTGEDELLKEAVGQLQFDFKQDDLLCRAKLRLADCFVMLDMSDVAEMILQELIARLEPQKPDCAHYLDAQYMLGSICEKKGDRVSAARAYAIVVGRNIRYRDVFARLRTVRRETAKEQVC